MNSMRSLRRLLTMATGLILVAYLGHFLFVRRAQLAQVFDIRPATVVGLSGLILLTMFLRTYQFQLMLSILNAPVPFRRVAYLVLSGQLLNYLFFRPGTLMQAAILKKESSLKYASFVSLFTAQLLLLLFSAGFLAVAGLLLTNAPPHANTRLMLMFFAAMTLLPVLILCIPGRWVVRRRTWVGRAVGDLLGGWEQFRARPLRLSGVVATIVLRLFATAARLWLCFAAMRVEVTFLACLTLGAVIQLTFIVNFTPGGLGLRQVLVGGAALANGLTFEQGMLASSLDHGVTIIMTLVTGIPALLLLMRTRPPGGKGSDPSIGQCG